MHSIHKIPFACSKSGAMVRATDVVSGLMCECQCPSCGRDVIAYHPRLSDRVSHFAHRPLAPNESTPPCANASETAMHRMAKQLICANSQFLLPEFSVEATARDERGKAHKVTEKQFDAKLVPIKSASEEVRLTAEAGFIKADVLLEIGDRKLVVEVYVTHKTDRVKRDLAKALSLSVIEIDLSDLDQDTIFDNELFTEAVLHDVRRRRWVYNHKHASDTEQAQLKAIAKADAANEQYRRQDETRRQREALEIERLRRDKALKDTYVRKRRGQFSRIIAALATKVAVRVDISTEFNGIPLPDGLLLTHATRFELTRYSRWDAWQLAILNRLQAGVIGEQILFGELMEIALAAGSPTAEHRAFQSARDEVPPSLRHVLTSPWCFLKADELQQVLRYESPVSTLIQRLQLLGLFAGQPMLSKLILQKRPFDCLQEIITNKRQEIERKRLEEVAFQKQLEMARQTIAESEARQAKTREVERLNALQLTHLRLVLATELRTFRLFSDAASVFRCSDCFCVCDGKSGQSCEECGSLNFMPVVFNDLAPKTYGHVRALLQLIRDRLPESKLRSTGNRPELITFEHIARDKLDVELRKA